MLLERLRTRTKTRPNPLFYAERVQRLLDGERVERALSDPSSVDLLTWNVFESLDSDPDRDYLAHVLAPVGGGALAAPLRITLWTGRNREPLLRPSQAYGHELRERVGEEGAVAEFLAPVEVPVRIESPGVLALVETTLDGLPRGAGGRDRLVELVDAGLEHARYLGKELTVTVVYRSGSATAAELSTRINRLRDPAALAAALPWRSDVPAVAFREVSWQHLLQAWQREQGNLRLFGEPVREFLAYCEALGLR
jgi:hypothetical protein